MYWHYWIKSLIIGKMDRNRSWPQDSEFCALCAKYLLIEFCVNNRELFFVIYMCTFLHQVFLLKCLTPVQ